MRAKVVRRDAKIIPFREMVMSTRTCQHAAPRGAPHALLPRRESRENCNNPRANIPASFLCTPFWGAFPDPYWYTFPAISQPFGQPFLLSPMPSTMHLATFITRLFHHAAQTGDRESLAKQLIPSLIAASFFTRSRSRADSLQTLQTCDIDCMMCETCLFPFQWSNSNGSRNGSPQLQVVDEIWNTRIPVFTPRRRFACLETTRCAISTL